MGRFKASVDTWILGSFKLLDLLARCQRESGGLVTGSTTNTGHYVLGGVEGLRGSSLSPRCKEAPEP